MAGSIRSNAPKSVSLKGIYRLILRSQLILILSFALILGGAGIVLNILLETEKRDQNLQNVAESIAHSPILTDRTTGDTADILGQYLDALKDSLEDIDVISVVDRDGCRIYHSNHNLIGTRYDGSMPDFSARNDGYYAVNETGPSGSQRRAYAAITDHRGQQVGFVMAIMLTEHILDETMKMLAVSLLITVTAVLMELMLAGEFSKKLKTSLLGYEPDVFTAMYRMRDNILETLEEGILATDRQGVIQFANGAAERMLCGGQPAHLTGQSIRDLGDGNLAHHLRSGGREQNIRLEQGDILMDRVPILENGEPVGAVAILRNRAEYTRLMEDLSGTRYLVDAMRANNHDFTNKLHVILGLIQMEMYEEASSYIQNITLVQKETISQVMHAVSDPAVAALLIGKIARASELNVRFLLREGCRYTPSDMGLPSETLISLIGNLLDNAFDALDLPDYRDQKELAFGIYSRPGALLITVDDTGCGIPDSDLERVFEKGYSTKGEGRGTGLFQVKAMVENMGGKIVVESQEGVGTSFSVSFTGGSIHV